jgi:hypothetical protein
MSDSQEVSSSSSSSSSTPSSSSSSSPTSTPPASPPLKLKGGLSSASSSNGDSAGDEEEDEGDELEVLQTIQKRLHQLQEEEEEEEKGKGICRMDSTTSINNKGKGGRKPIFKGGAKKEGDTKNILKWKIQKVKNRNGGIVERGEQEQAAGVDGWYGIGMGMGMVIGEDKAEEGGEEGETEFGLLRRDGAMMGSLQNMAVRAVTRRIASISPAHFHLLVPPSASPSPSSRASSQAATASASEGEEDETAEDARTQNPFFKRLESSEEIHQVMADHMCATAHLHLVPLFTKATRIDLDFAVRGVPLRICGLLTNWD